MIAMRRASILLAMVLLAQHVVHAGEFASHASSFTLIAQSAVGWDVRYVPAPARQTTVMIDGMPFRRFLEVGESENSQGAPALPVDVLTLGIPFGATLTAEVVEGEFADEENVRVAPLPSYEFTPDNDAIELYHPDAAAYTTNGFVPSTLLTVETPFTLREQHIAVVRVHPYQYNPATKLLRRIVRATLRLRLTNSLVSDRNPQRRTNDPYFESIYKSLLWNYEQARRWRVPINDRRSTLDPDPTRDWFETNRTYYKISIADDGWHKLTRADLIAAGADLGTIDLPSLKVFYRGAQVPIVVRPDTTIEFHAYRHRGDSTDIDYYTDTSAYWLTWGGEAGLRFGNSSVSGVPARTVSSSMHALHREENYGYFSGAIQIEQIDIHTVPGEGWYWRWFNVNNESNFSFMLDSLDASVTQCTVRVRLWGTSFSASLPMQRARFWINDSLVGEVDFPQRTAAQLEAAIPTSWLRAGTNTLRVLNVNLGLGNTQFYLDWIEVVYPRMLRASNNQVQFLVRNDAGANPVEFIVRGFTDPSIEVFELTTRRKLSDIVVTGDSSSGYVASFLDTVTVPHTYVAFAAPGWQPVPPLRQKRFADIRTNANGADYIIITHKRFLSQAQHLAAHRQTVNGVRPKVIDVDDLYDEFNYGMLNATALKTFLHYAYRQWAPPAPSYVVLFGDASFDYHKYYGAASIKANYVPAYGFPPADNWFGCFDTTYSFLPSLNLGRIPCENEVQAQIAVNKIIAYDIAPVSGWNKKFLVITGGVNASEQATFNYLADNTIGTYIVPPPVGGTPLRVYKSTPGYVDGENKERVLTLIREGVSYMSFTGHSGGRIWGVDVGHPSQLENTDGKLPFVSSVTCNVGGFATPQNSVLSEDFLFADNRGAIASWASASIGFVTYGWLLNNYWLATARDDSVREIGALVTSAFYRLWVNVGSGAVTIAMINLNPLIGDPLSRFALPRKPDLAVTPDDVQLSVPYPTPNDSLLTIRLLLHNYGLVPSDSVGVTLTDLRSGVGTQLLNNFKLPPTLHVDSLLVPWNGKDFVGLHTLTVSLDPDHRIEELSEVNNFASNAQYVYANNVYIVKPLNNMAVPPGVQRLVVTSPVGYDSSGFSYRFELDTVATFDSPALVASGPVVPQQTKGEWQTPSLPEGRVYFWRVRTQYNTLVGNWVTSSFITSNDVPMPTDPSMQKVRVRVSDRKQFSRDRHINTQPTDSGVIIAPRAPLSLYVRSVGFRYNQTREYYSTVRANGQYAIGYWWELGSSFMVMRVNDFDGTFTFRSFNTASDPALADSMRAFISNTPAGNYIGVSVIFDGQSNVSEALKRTMDTLGATFFRSIRYGQSYAFLGRKGNGAPGMTALEQLTNDTAVVRLIVPNYYSLGSGSVISAAMPVPSVWDSLHGRTSGDAARTDLRFVVMGERSNGALDTLRIVPRDSADVSLASLNTQLADSQYASVRTAVMLSTNDANVTPLLRAWWMDVMPPADLAISARTLGSTNAAVFNFPITVSNIGYRTSDSVLVVLNAFDKSNNRRKLAEALLDSLPPDSSRTVTVPIPVPKYGYRTILQVVVRPRRNAPDLVAENNTAYYTLYTGNIAPPKFQVYRDGRLMMDGDVVPPKSAFVVRLVPDENRASIAAAELEMFVSGRKVEQNAVALAKASSGAREVVEHAFSPSLPNGTHELRFRWVLMNRRGEVDTLEHTLHVQVLAESKILEPFVYPNPFQRDAHFMFVLAGSSPPEAMRIRIFTVAGRMIRAIDIPGQSLQIGFNQVYWDGRDADGDEIANGYYFYEITLHNDGKTSSTIQKLAKIR